MLVPVGQVYRPALPISQRAELAAAFAQGRARLAAGQACDAQQGEQLTGLSPDARIAYRLGLAGSEGLQAPARLAVAIPMLLAEVVAAALARTPRSRRHEIALFLAYALVVVYGQRASERARVRRGRALGLAAETAPLPGSLAVALGQMVGRLALVGVQQVRVRHRARRWGRVSLSSIVAAGAIRELRLRQDWNAAYTSAEVAGPVVRTGPQMRVR